MKLSGRETLIIAVLLISHLLSASVSAQQNQPSSSYQLIAGKSYVQSKNYYLLTLFDELPEARNLIVSDPVLADLAVKKSASLASSLKTCQRDAFCYSAAMKFSDEEIKVIGDRLKELYTPTNALGKLVSQHLSPSGAYILFSDLSPVEMLVKAWEQDAMGINFSIGVYAEGKKANYPLIDSISLHARSAGYFSLLYNTASMLVEQLRTDRSFYAIPLNSSLSFLEMNERNQAADYEPMSATVNKAAYDRVKAIDWKTYPYAVIVVPGAGPDEPDVALSAEGMIRCRLAAVQYNNHDAPFIIVSGGKVHPYKTKYNEAEEMKKFLVNQLHIPEFAVIMDPHARHTTTNMRNAVRLMYRYGIPFNKPGVTCTTRGQSFGIGTSLIDRCLKELDEVPYKNGKRLSETAIEFFPLIEALHIDPTEPMDP